MQPSSQLTATLSPYIHHFLNWTGRNYKHNYNDLRFEFWQTCLWVEREGMISYSELAQFLNSSHFSASMQRPYRQLSCYHFAVAGNHRPWYTVEVREGKYKCNCPRWRCWDNRLEDELPRLIRYWRDNPKGLASLSRLLSPHEPNQKSVKGKAPVKVWSIKPTLHGLQLHPLEKSRDVSSVVYTGLYKKCS